MKKLHHIDIKPIAAKLNFTALACYSRAYLAHDTDTLAKKSVITKHMTLLIQTSLIEYGRNNRLTANKFFTLINM